MNTREDKATKRRRLLESLASAPVRTCYSMHWCVLCDREILLGQEYRDRKCGRRAHESCFQEATLREVG